ncbi:MAG: MGMT family protein [Candidatus Aenigmatarchaeota archaeon]
MDKEKIEELKILLKKIPHGKVCSYKEIARALGNPNAARAVGRMLNKVAKLGLPCHRVVHCDGSIGGYAFGRDEKIRKLKADGIRVKNGKIDRAYFHYFKNNNLIPSYKDSE